MRSFESPLEKYFWVVYSSPVLLALAFGLIVFSIRRYRERNE